ncbi:hypothetical protein BC940DRAFT_51724 [Gongronella butleri]|nr:hypothetical protein BC940DRAFT_51724 [Gongronella butleri]
MRPDEHKSKDSRRYQQKKKKQGDETAAAVAAERRQRQRENDRGQGVAAIRRRNGETPSRAELDAEQEEQQRQRAAQFSRRKITSNVDRYSELSMQDELEMDAEQGIDRETTDLVAMVEDVQGQLGTQSASYFKFKDEQDKMAQPDQTYQSLLQIDMDSMGTKCQQIETRDLFCVDPDNEDDADLIDSMYEHDWVALDKPLIPTMNKTRQGTILFQTPVKHEASPTDGIHIRNATPQFTKQKVETPKNDQDDELDALLELKNGPVPQAAIKPATPAPPVPPVPHTPVKKVTQRLKVPGSSVNKQQSASIPKNGKSSDDQAWLDDLLG